MLRVILHSFVLLIYFFFFRGKTAENGSLSHDESFERENRKYFPWREENTPPKTPNKIHKLK